MFDNTNRKALLTSIGSVIAGFIASLCCIGPLIFVILGLSGAAFFAKLEQYRWIFKSTALGFFFTYKGGDKGVLSECSKKDSFCNTN